MLPIFFEYSIKMNTGILILFQSSCKLIQFFEDPAPKSLMLMGKLSIDF